MYVHIGIVERDRTTQLSLALFVIISDSVTLGERAYNSKANGQVKWMIRTLKDCIWCGLTKMPETFWTNHLASVLLLLHMTVSRMTGVMPYLLATG